MSNLDIYERVRVVPQKAQREIKGGRLNGKTDINPMWRIKTLTAEFGPCGIGWKTAIKNKWLEKGSGEEVAAFVDIELFVKINGEWSDAILGTGGSMFVAKEKGGLYTDDEAFKKAYTDAISVACKALGIGADVYWDKDSSKYDTKGEDDSDKEPETEEELPPIDEAIKMTTPKGSKLCDLTNEQLEQTAKVTNNAALSKAAKAILKHRKEVGANGNSVQ